MVLSAAEPTQLFNGKDLTGWVMVGPGRFVVENGLLKTEGGMGLLYYRGQKFANQSLRVVFKTGSEHANRLAGEGRWRFALDPPMHRGEVCESFCRQSSLREAAPGHICQTLPHRSFDGTRPP